MKGVGLVRWNVVDDDDRKQTIETAAFYVPDIPVRLFSPQAYMKGKSVCNFRMHAANSIFTWEKGNTMTLAYHPRSKLPVANGIPTTETTTSALTCVTEENNQNITAAQKSLLRWHFRLGHAGFEHVQWLARQRHLGN
ncbi:MAG: GAG-pre-integrase domain-containing protein, partial [Gloeomargaritales cyanobacterium]